jgi:hypothetical protein
VKEACSQGNTDLLCGVPGQSLMPGVTGPTSLSASPAVASATARAARTISIPRTETSKASKTVGASNEAFESTLRGAAEVLRRAQLVDRLRRDLRKYENPARDR